MNIESILNRIDRNGLTVARTQLAVTADGAKLFGVIDVANGPGFARQLGFRNATDESMAIRGVAGHRVFVCDNMALSGDEFSVSRKNTTGLDYYGLDALVSEGINRWLSQTEILSVKIEALAAAQLSNDNAKAIIYDALIAEVVPKSMLGAIDGFYFSPEPTEDAGVGDP